MWQGKRWREPYPYVPTKANIQAAGRLRAKVINLIKLDAFDEQHYLSLFPNTTQIEIHDAVITFANAAQGYLDDLTVSPAVRNEYRKILQSRWMPLLADRAISSITFPELRQMTRDHQWPSNKTRNNCLTPLRRVFEWAVDGELIDSNPAAKLKNLKHQKLPVDPFTREEVAKILGYMHSEFTGMKRIYFHYFELAFNTGMRTSELLALEWDDIDFKSGYALVDKAKVRGVVRNTTKTANFRHVSLNENSIRTICALRELTGTHHSRLLFLAPQTMEPVTSYKAPLKVWKNVLKEQGIRYRRPYNTRHTYASLAFMKAIPIGLIAKQLGHSVTTLAKDYATWMKTEEDKRHLSNINLPSFGGLTIHAGSSIALPSLK
ncbi:tyrosine-type recombinase/integrase [Marinobacterium marinum]|nr:tyrosine-type recombinase/integrase [Marinobacterium marinum]